MKSPWSKKEKVKYRTPPQLNQLISQLFNTEPLSYEQLKDTRKQLFDIWGQIKDDRQDQLRWFNGFDQVTQLLNIKKQEAFISGNILWRQAGGFTDAAKTILVEDINIMEHTKDWQAVKEMPYGNKAPYHNKRPVTVYKLSTHKTIYFGFTEVSNGCYCCWSRSVD